MHKSISAIFLFISALSISQAFAQVTIDVDSETARKASGETNLSDLSVNDTAIIYSTFCATDKNLYLPGWKSPTNLADATYAATGVLLKVVILPGKRVKLTYVDAAQAQSIAKGNASAPAVLSKEAYAKAVMSDVANIFDGGLFGTEDCEQLRARNPLRPLELYEVDSINGFRTISELMKSIGH